MTCKAAKATQSFTFWELKSLKDMHDQTEEIWCNKFLLARLVQTSGHTKDRLDRAIVWRRGLLRCVAVMSFVFSPSVEVYNNVLPRDIWVFNKRRKPQVCLCRARCSMLIWISEVLLPRVFALSLRVSEEFSRHKKWNDIRVVAVHGGFSWLWQICVSLEPDHHFQQERFGPASFDLQLCILGDGFRHRSTCQECGRRGSTLLAMFGGGGGGFAAAQGLGRNPLEISGEVDKFQSNRNWILSCMSRWERFVSKHCIYCILSLFIDNHNYYMMIIISIITICYSYNYIYIITYISTRIGLKFEQTLCQDVLCAVWRLWWRWWRLWSAWGCAGCSYGTPYPCSRWWMENWSRLTAIDGRCQAAMNPPATQAGVPLLWVFRVSHRTWQLVAACCSLETPWNPGQGLAGFLNDVPGFAFVLCHCHSHLMRSYCVCTRLPSHVVPEFG